AFKLLSTSERVLPEEMYMVGHRYLHGIGVIKNAQDAHLFFQMAAEHGVKGLFD
ncbi:10159_t:CDS:1, partial [Cetraspora pellucida]